MSSYPHDKPLSEHTINTLKELVESESKSLSEESISSIQACCARALFAATDWFFENPSAVAALIKKFEDLSERDQMQILSQFQHVYILPFMYEIRGLLEEIVNLQDCSFPQELVDMRMESIESEIANKLTDKETLVDTLKGTAWMFLGESKGDKPKSVITHARQNLFAEIYRIYKDDSGTGDPSSNENGIFWQFMETIITDPNMEMFDGKSIEDWIKGAKKKYDYRVAQPRFDNKYDRKIASLESAITELKDGELSEELQSIVTEWGKNGRSDLDLIASLKKRVCQLREERDNLHST